MGLRLKTHGEDMHKILTYFVCPCICYRCFNLDMQQIHGKNRICSVLKLLFWLHFLLASALYSDCAIDTLLASRRPERLGLPISSCKIVSIRLVRASVAAQSSLLINGGNRLSLAHRQVLTTPPTDEKIQFFLCWDESSDVSRQFEQSNK